MSSVAPARPRFASSLPGANAADLSEAMGKVQDIIAEMTSSPEALKATLERSARVQALAAEQPAVAAALKDPAQLAQQMKLFDAMHQILTGMKGALSDPLKRQKAVEELKRLQMENAEAPVPAS